MKVDFTKGAEYFEVNKKDLTIDFGFMGFPSPHTKEIAEWICKQRIKYER